MATSLAWKFAGIVHVLIDRYWPNSTTPESPGGTAIVAEASPNPSIGTTNVGIGFAGRNSTQIAPELE